MVFSSIIFICFFLPAVLCIYHLIPSRKVKNAFLIIVSLLFYAYGEAARVLLMLVCALWNYIMALAVSKAQGRSRKTLFILSFSADLLLLAVYKYAAMIIGIINGIPGVSLPVPSIALPIGISFFTFQAMSYVADVYRGTIEAQPSFAKVLLYISFFPQLIAGPIVRYRDIAREIDDRSVSVSDTAQGLRRFIFGLSKKVLISNNVAKAADYVFGLTKAELSFPLAWLGAIAYMLQIYFDFSGYSDMAIGLGRMFGFHFLENFKDPYCADSMLDFWRRWHISLTNWFRENLYFPLGGNRRGKTRTWINRFIVFFFTGLWHGANWTFVLWGLYHGAITSFEACFPNFTKKMPKILRHIYVLVIVCVGFTIFRADSVSQAGMVLGSMFSPCAMTTARAAALSGCADALSLAAIIAGALLALPSWNYIKRVPERFTYVLTIPLLILCLCSLAGGAYNPFIYFRF